MLGGQLVAWGALLGGICPPVLHSLLQCGGGMAAGLTETPQLHLPLLED